MDWLRKEKSKYRAKHPRSIRDSLGLGEKSSSAPGSSPSLQNSQLDHSDPQRDVNPDSASGNRISPDGGQPSQTTGAEDSASVTASGQTSDSAPAPSVFQNTQPALDGPSDLPPPPNESPRFHEGKAASELNSQLWREAYKSLNSNLKERFETILKDQLQLDKSLGVEDQIRNVLEAHNKRVESLQWTYRFQGKTKNVRD